MTRATGNGSAGRCARDVILCRLCDPGVQADGIQVSSVGVFAVPDMPDLWL